MLLAAVAAGCSARPEPGRGAATGITPASRAPAAPASVAVPVPAAPTGPHPATVTGVAPAAREDVPSVVVLRPSTVYAYPPQAATPMMDQMARRFTPGALLVRTGEVASFRNDDDTIHNVRVRERGHESDDPAFNIALPQGGSYDYIFQKDGVWDVRCDMHQNMAAVVVSSTAPYATVAAVDGAFSIPDVPSGHYTVVLYAGGSRSEQEIDVREGQRVRLNLR